MQAIENPYFFERLVAKFITALGYGEEYEVTARSGDLGIGGIVWYDKLGLGRVCIQAKRYRKASRSQPKRGAHSFIASGYTE